MGKVAMGREGPAWMQRARAQQGTYLVCCLGAWASADPSPTRPPDASPPLLHQSYSAAPRCSADHGQALHGEELPLGLCQLPDREPGLRLPGACGGRRAWAWACTAPRPAAPLKLWPSSAQQAPRPSQKPASWPYPPLTPPYGLGPFRPLRPCPRPQTKDTLTLRASSFGSKCELPDPYLKKVANAGLMDAVLSFASFKANKDMKKSDGAKRSRLTGGRGLTSFMGWRARAGGGAGQGRLRGTEMHGARLHLWPPIRTEGCVCLPQPVPRASC